MKYIPVHGDNNSSNNSSQAVDMDTGEAPDCWDQQSNDGGGDPQVNGDITETASNLSALNINAPTFVPGRNIFAQEFVPNFNVPGVESSHTEMKPQIISQQPPPPLQPPVPPAVIVTPSSELLEEDRSPEDEDRTPDDWDDNSEADKRSQSPGSEMDDESATGTETEGEESAPRLKPKKLTKKSDPEKKKCHLNIVFIGHVDAGKSTICGHLMFLTGMVDKRTLEKYEKEAKEKNRESWYLSWAIDTNQEERDKGKTVEVGRAYFETETKHFTILDAPGHRSFVPNMIGGASQADVAVLVISARRGEFETGFERGGQTREHAMLVKTAGVRQLIIVVNKMDDPTVEWDELRFLEIQDKLTPYLRKCGFNPKTDLFYIPVSGLTGAFLRDPCLDEQCSWYSGPALIPHLDGITPVSRMAEGPLRIPVVDKYKDMGTIVLGKVESGSVKCNDTIMMMPNRILVEVMQLWSDEEECKSANPGENVKLKLKNVEEEDVTSGFVLCSPENTCETCSVFDAQVVILEHKSIICAGYQAVMHIHTSAEEVTIKALICLVDRKTGEKSTTRPRFVKQDQIAIARFEITGGVVCLEPFKTFPQMGRFTLRDEGRTIAIGKVLKLIA